ncbi:hypothetical protein AOLI_G00000770 [Acnodon oligacanthus]
MEEGGWSVKTGAVTWREKDRDEERDEERGRRGQAKEWTELEEGGKTERDEDSSAPLRQMDCGRDCLSLTETVRAKYPALTSVEGRGKCLLENLQTRDGDWRNRGRQGRVGRGSRRLFSSNFSSALRFSAAVH